MTEQDYAARVPGPCIFPGCVSRERHHHNGFPGGYDDPADPEGPPIPFMAEPAPGVRDYNGAILAAPAPSERCAVCGDEESHQGAVLFAESSVRHVITLRGGSLHVKL